MDFLRLFVVMLTLVYHVDGKINVLFLVSDDMRPNINAYAGADFPAPIHPKMHTPNLDALAAKSLLLKKAYVQQAVGGNFTTIPEYFKQNGYRSIGMGKVFHPGHASDDDDPPSWTEPYYHAPNLGYWDSHKASWIAVDEKTRIEKPLPDEQIAAHAIKTIKYLAATPQQPFFLAVGFHKPHLPFVFPEEFLGLYPEKNIHLPDNQYAPVNMPQFAWFNFEGLRSYNDIKALNASGAINTTFPPKVVLELRRAYYSALSFTDFLLGEVVKTLHNSGLANNTIVSFWGDHGWQLGEHGEWCKQTNFELATHAPMMIHVPGLTNNGIMTEQLTEFVDLFPTLVEAAGLPELPLCPENSTLVQLCREGTSLMPLMTKEDVKWKEQVFSQYPREEYMGYTMRTLDFRYTEWVKFEGAPHYKPVWENNVGTKLYDHRVDQEENYNHAGEPAYKEIEKKLSQQLHAGWRKAIPQAELDQSDNKMSFKHVQISVNNAGQNIIL